MTKFPKINKGYNSVFQSDKLSIGLVVPIENYSTSLVPRMQDHLRRVQQVEEYGFKAVWVRDVPFHVPEFGDAGQTYDPFTYLGYLAGQTSEIALGVSSIALPLHHPVHVAKSATTIDQLSGGRMILGVASGDRAKEYPAMNVDYDIRSELFRDAFRYIRKSQKSFPKIPTQNYGNTQGDIDILPKAYGSKIPMIITGSSQQTLYWNAENGDGWMSYPQDIAYQKMMIDRWRGFIQGFNKPFMQSLYIDLQEDDDFPAQIIHLGFRIGINGLRDHLKKLQEIGVNHVALNLRFNTMNMEKTLETIAKKILPDFHT